MGDERYQSVIDTFGREKFELVKNSRVLVVGAGGIGCEILKNLVLTGFFTIEIIDLDTIDVSNLNRQFLFRNEHVGQPKAVVAAAAAMAFNPDAKITAHYGNVKDTKFGIKYVETFDIVLNALDNIDARRHVNRLCLAAQVPLIDSGTTGYLGQVMPIFKGKTACYECTPKPTQKVYPICTIRSTPDKPVHCIVWAKECFKLLFGQTSESMLYEDPASGESSTYMELVDLAFATEADPVKLLTHGTTLLSALYNTEVVKRIDMGIYKTARTPPLPVSQEVFQAAQSRALSIIADPTKVCRLLCLSLVSTHHHSSPLTHLPTTVNPHSPKYHCQPPLTQLSPSQDADWDRTMWTDEDCAVEMLLCFWEASNLCRRDASLHRKMCFDKDDAMAMRFVCAAANIRSRVFTIPAQSYHDAKGIAGNIIPAIATTNAIVAGIQVLQAFQVVASGRSDGALAACPHTYCLRMPTRKGVYLQPSAAEAPVAACYVCNTAQMTIQIDTNVATLGDLLKYVIKGKLGFNAPSLLVGHSGLYEEGEDADESLAANLPLLLSACPAGGVVDGTVVTIQDFTQDLEVQLVVQHVDVEKLTALKEATGKGEAVVDSPGELFILGGSADMRKAAAAADSGEAEAEAEAEDDMVVIQGPADETDRGDEGAEEVVLVSRSSPAKGQGTKRPRDEEDAVDGGRVE